MPIDYSKWDHLELSDDSDIEVHPNVDKRSFIRWKQQDIHQKRAERNAEIKNLNVQIPMYKNLNNRVDNLLQEFNDEQLADLRNVKAFLAKNYDDSKPMEDGPSHNEMIEDLLIQLKNDLQKEGMDPNDGSVLRDSIKAHRSKIDDVLKQQEEKLETLLKEKSLQISSDDIKTGWDRSFLNKDSGKGEVSTAAPTASSYSATASSITTSAPSSTTTGKPTKSESKHDQLSHPVTPPQKTSSNASSQQTAQDFELEEVHEDTYTLSTLPMDAIPTIKQFIKTHTHIIKPAQKDALLMKAFDAQFQHDDHRTKQIIYFSTLIQYVYDLVEFKNAKNPNEIAIIADQLLGKLFDGDANNKAHEAFVSEVERTYQHIKTRCAVLSEEQGHEDEDDLHEIQLKSLDDNTKLIVNLPGPNSEDPEEQERYRIFNTLPQKMIDALRTEELDNVNEVFHGMPIKEAEDILEIFDQCGIIGVQALVENEDDWQKIKHDYESHNINDENSEPHSQVQTQSQSQSQSQTPVPKIEEVEFDTVDIVD